MEREQPLRIVGHRALGPDRQTGLREPLEQRRVRGWQLDTVGFADAVREEAQRPAGGDRRIELSQASGGRIARIDEFAFAGVALARFSRSKSRRYISTSPRTSSTRGAMPISRSGIARTVRMFAVTSSPLAPSPRVAPCTSRPCS